MEVIKGRMQLQVAGAGTISTMKKVYNKEGFRGFYRGYWMVIFTFRSLPSDTFTDALLRALLCSLPMQ